MTTITTAHIDWCPDPGRLDLHNEHGECVRKAGVYDGGAHLVTTVASAGPCGYVASLTVKGIVFTVEQVDVLIDILQRQRERLAVARAVWECECDTDECQNQPRSTP